MGDRHSISIWRSPVPWGWLLEVHCSCGYRAERLTDYDEAEVIATEHRDEMQRLLDLEQEEAQHG